MKNINWPFASINKVYQIIVSISGARESTQRPLQLFAYYSLNFAAKQEA